MSVLTIVNSVFNVLATDPAFLDYHGLTTSSTMAEKVAKIQQELEPNSLSTTNIPLTCIYPIPGLRSKTHDLIYEAMFEIASFSDTQTGIKTATTKAGAMRIIERAIELLQYIQLGGATLKVEFQSAFADNSGVAGIKKCVARFKVGEEIIR